MKKIYIAAGCFWCIADVFLKTKGILDVVSGYSGGKEINPSYELVKSQKTNYRETIEISYDELLINQEDILDIFFENIDPFDNDGQFIDRGHSYTLALFFQNKEDELLYHSFINKKQLLFEKKIAISVEPWINFYKAEEYHQKYSLKNPKKFEEELISSGRKK